MKKIPHYLLALFLCAIILFGCQSEEKKEAWRKQDSIKTARQDSLSDALFKLELWRISNPKSEKVTREDYQTMVDFLKKEGDPRNVSFEKLGLKTYRFTDSKGTSHHVNITRVNSKGEYLADDGEVLYIEVIAYKDSKEKGESADNFCHYKIWKDSVAMNWESDFPHIGNHFADVSRGYQEFRWKALEWKIREKYK